MGNAFALALIGLVLAGAITLLALVRGRPRQPYPSESENLWGDEK